MNSTYSDVRQDAQSDAPAHMGGHYTAQAIAEAYNVSDSTIRNRWFSWINQVVPTELLKHKQGYTELAHTLFGEFSTVRACERKSWE